MFCFRWHGTQLVTTSIKTSPGNEQWRAFVSIRHNEKRLPLKLHSFGERAYFSLKYLTWFRELSIWKHTTSYDKGVGLWQLPKVSGAFKCPTYPHFTLTKVLIVFALGKFGGHRSLTYVIGRNRHRIHFELSIGLKHIISTLKCIPRSAGPWTFTPFKKVQTSVCQNH